MEKSSLIQLTPQSVEAIVKVQQFFKNYDKTAAWFNTENPGLGFICPITMINKGRSEKLLMWIKNQIEGNIA